MKEIKEKHKQREIIEKRGVVFNAEQTRIRNEELELRETKEFRDFGQFDFKDVPKQGLISNGATEFQADSGIKLCKYLQSIEVLNTQLNELIQK